MRTKPLDSEPEYEETDMKSIVIGGARCRIRSVMKDDASAQQAEEQLGLSNPYNH